MPAHLRLAPSAGEKDRSSRPQQPIRVVLADDHPGVRRSVRLLLDEEEDIEVTAEATDLVTIGQEVRHRPPHVLVLDLRFRNGSGVEIVRELRSQVPETQIVVLTMTESPLFAQQALDAGAVGFVLVDRANSELVAAVRLAAQGEEYVSARVSLGLGVLRQAFADGGLSPREVEILRLVALGYTSREIADSLNLSRRTIETHRNRIYQKLKLKTRAELVQFALRNHLIKT